MGAMAIPSYRSNYTDFVFLDLLYTWYVLNEGLVLVSEEEIQLPERGERNIVIINRFHVKFPC
jgi:hypothetical protein